MTTASSTARRSWRDRITTVVWGALITATGILGVYALNGNSVDLELAVIAGLIVLGGWLLLSALIAARPTREFTPALTTPAATAVTDPLKKQK